MIGLAHVLIQTQNTIRSLSEDYAMRQAKLLVIDDFPVVIQSGKWHIMEDPSTNLFTFSTKASETVVLGP